jgi:hypothetical protein
MFIGYSTDVFEVMAMAVIVPVSSPSAAVIVVVVGTQ